MARLTADMTHLRDACGPTSLSDSVLVLGAPSMGSLKSVLFFGLTLGNFSGTDALEPSVPLGDTPSVERRLLLHVLSALGPSALEDFDEGEPTSLAMAAQGFRNTGAEAGRPAKMVAGKLPREA